MYGKEFKMAAFERHKLACLSQVDLSKKGSIDDQILDLVHCINSKDNYFTTSSCSGRVSVFSELAEQKKKHCEWLHVTHSTAEAEEVCKDLESGQLMLKTALVSGFKNSGIVIGKKANVIVAVRSTQSLEVPLVHNGELMVSDEYVKFLVDVANRKLEENQTRIDRFFSNLCEILTCDLDGSLTHKKTGQGTTHNRKDTRQDKGLLHAATNRTSQQSTVTADATEQCNGDDIMDCLVSFYGDVP